MKRSGSGGGVEVEWNGMEWSGVEWSGVERSGVEWNGVEWRRRGGEGGEELAVSKKNKNPILRIWGSKNII